MPTFSPNLEHTLHRSVAAANKRQHEFATLEHLLLGLLDDQDAVAVLRACDVNITQLGAELRAYLDQELENITEETSLDATPTAGFQRVIQRSILHVQSSGREEV
ncbi:MAG: ATP-dependent Clp protease ATP-binding subunit ClpA, partial [Kordiimonadaceae bacterium]|nr:ATP-dependent Clp protease ATP-binding subunit ClpA [Kordiimonadaceae bacterium]